MPEDAASNPIADNQLLRRFRQTADARAFALLVKRHQPMVYSVCYHVLGHQQDAEDAFQATFMVLAKNAKQIRKTAALADWLYGVAYRISLQVRRKRSRSLSDQEEQQVESPYTDPLDRLTAQYQSSVAFEELAKLPSRLRGPMILRYLDGLSNREVAEELNLSESAVEGRLKRAKAKLRIQLVKHGVTMTVAAAAFSSVREVHAAHASSHLLEQTVDHCLGARQSASSLDVAEREILQFAQKEIVAMTTLKACKAAIAGGVALCVATMAISVHHFANPAYGSDPFAPDEGGASSRDDPFGSGGEDVQVVEGFDPFGDAPASDPFGGAPAPKQPKVRISAAEDAEPDSTVPKPKRYDRKQRTSAEIGIENALNEKTHIDFIETPLSEVTDYLSQVHEIQIVLDTPALTSEGVTVDTPVTKELKDVSLRSALNLIGRDLELDYMISDEVLMITSQAVAATTMEPRLYVFDDAWPVSKSELAQLLMTAVAPESWSDTGGHGTIIPYQEGLLVRQNQRIHHQINELLNQLAKSGK